MKDTKDCKHIWEFLRTCDDWWDGDEDDIYECKLCGKQRIEYIPR